MFYLGIDVAKAKLDCVLLNPVTQKRKSKTVTNTLDGLTALLSWCHTATAEPAELHVIMEPTSTYHELAATHLHDAGCKLSLVNPAKLRAYATSVGTRSKTDAADAAVLARYGAHEHPRRWHPPPPAARALRALLARRDAVAEDLQRERNRFEKSEIVDIPAAVRQSLEAGIAFLDKQLEALQQEISDHIDHDPDLRAKRDLLLSIPGVGDRVAQHMAALLAWHRFDTAEQLAAYLGLIPVEWQSGSSIKGPPHLSKAGPAHLRKLLYFPAIVATRHNAHIRATYERLLNSGKSKMSAIGAAMRKLAHLCFGVVQSGKPYDSAFKSKRA
jgi:transposase